MITISKQVNWTAIYCILGVMIIVIILGSLDSFSITHNKELVNNIEENTSFVSPIFSILGSYKIT